MLSTKVRKNRKATARWQRTKVLIIDEGILYSLTPPWNCHSLGAAVSMLDGDLFDKLSEIASTIRNSPIPFGGIQVS